MFNWYDFFFKFWVNKYSNTFLNRLDKIQFSKSYLLIYNHLSSNINLIDFFFNSGLINNKISMQIIQEIKIIAYTLTYGFHISVQALVAHSDVGNSVIIKCNIFLLEVWWEIELWYLFSLKVHLINYEW